MEVTRAFCCGAGGRTMAGKVVRINRAPVLTL
jgi:hypothetical protein